VAAEMPVNPNTPAMIETMKKMSAHFNMVQAFRWLLVFAAA
jgi:hypothetical protein